MSSFQGLAGTIGRRGLFCPLYSDRGSHYFHTPKAGEKGGKNSLAQIGRALAKLGVEPIQAYWPQARGPYGARLSHVAGPAAEGTGLGGDHGGRRSRQLLYPRRLFARSTNDRIWEVSPFEFRLVTPKAVIRATPARYYSSEIFG
ncbi:MAG TPA: hypothetical protein VHT02_01845, partial [Methylocella sp.]|nr:hypothetical protein [Methylocella sp.]